MRKFLHPFHMVAHNDTIVVLSGQSWQIAIFNTLNHTWTTINPQGKVFNPDVDDAVAKVGDKVFIYSEGGEFRSLDLSTWTWSEYPVCHIDSQRTIADVAHLARPQHAGISFYASKEAASDISCCCRGKAFSLALW